MITLKIIFGTRGISCKLQFYHAVHYIALYCCFLKLFFRNIWMPINRLGLSHSTNSDQMLSIDINGVNKTANRKVLSQNKCIIHDLIGCNKECVTEITKKSIKF